ncbi:LPS-induced tumor necrosis factor alpha factor [Penicillium herquei]|nr:LPS-induced tumor necrosis factor alpha factor [Penicillium herquei]
MGGKSDSEGLIPVKIHQNTEPSPISPLHTSEYTDSSFSPPSALTASFPAPPYEHERTRPEDAPMPVNAFEMPGKESQGQIIREEHPALTSQPPIAGAGVKEYPGQPVANQFQPRQYYTPFGQPTTYATAVPLHALQSASCPVDCPTCGQREMTRIEAVSGTTTHGWAAVLCFCCCLGCIPYLISSLKDVDHFCGKCGVKLACWHNSGRVQVMQGPGSNKTTQQAGIGSGAAQGKSKE